MSWVYLISSFVSTIILSFGLYDSLDDVWSLAWAILFCVSAQQQQHKLTKATKATVLHASASDSVCVWCVLSRIVSVLCAAFDQMRSASTGDRVHKRHLDIAKSDTHCTLCSMAVATQAHKPHNKHRIHIGDCGVHCSSNSHSKWCTMAKIIPQHKPQQFE